MDYKQIAITFVVVVAAVIVAAMVSKKLGLNSYEEYQP